MLYQTIKFYIARLTVSLLMVVGVGFSFLYFVHEIALPNVVFDDIAVQWAVFVICIFFGFIGYGILGEQRFHNSLYNLKNISPELLVGSIKNQFEELIKFTYSSYFLPAKGKKYRKLGVLQFADYLLSIGDESSSALNIYAQALIQSPQNARFKKPLLSILNRGELLNQHEIDLLLIMFQKEDERDPVLTSYLAQIFLKAKQWSGQTEPVFISALNEENENSSDIVRFVLPIYLAHERTDEQALRFYVKALKYNVQEEDQIKNILGVTFCDGNLIGVAPDLHKNCERVFSQLSDVRQAQLKLKSDETKISYKLKKIKFLRKEDLKDLKSLKNEMGLVASRVSIVWVGIKKIIILLRRFSKWVLLRILDFVFQFGELPFKTKAGSFAVVLILIVGGQIYNEFWFPAQPKSINNSLVDSKQIKGNKGKFLYTVQIGALESSRNANKRVANLKKKNIESLYLVKAKKRRSPGYWYKLRVGKFKTKSEASDFANQLVASKTVKNYFIIPLPKK